MRVSYVPSPVFEEAKEAMMPRTRLMQILGALALLVAVFVMWQASGAFFRWASAPNAEHRDSED
jgi:hypothetical protein